MGFKSFISNGWNKLKSGLHQGLIGAKNVATKVWDVTKKGLIGAKNFVVNNPELVGTLLHAITPFATAFNPALGAITSTGASIFNNMPKGPVKDKIEKISEQFARGEIKAPTRGKIRPLKTAEIKPVTVDEINTPTFGGSLTAQAAVESRRTAANKSRKLVPFRGI